MDGKVKLPWMDAQRLQNNDGLFSLRALFSVWMITILEHLFSSYIPGSSMNSDQSTRDTTEMEQR